MYIFYYGQFTLSVHTNFTVTDQCGSTIKTNEHDIIQLNTNLNLKNALFSEKKDSMHQECLEMVITPLVVNISS